MDFFEILQQGADDADKKKNGEPPKEESIAEPAQVSAKSDKDAAREAREAEKNAAREAKQRERLQKQQAKEDARAEREAERERIRAEKEAERDTEDAADLESLGLAEEAAETGADDARASLAALLAGGAADEAVKPTEPAKFSIPTEVPNPKDTERFAAPKSAVSATTADEDPVTNYQWTAPMPAATGVVAASPVSADAQPGADASSGNGSGSGSGNGSDTGRKQRVLAWSLVSAVVVVAAVVAAAIAIPAMNNNAQPSPTPTKTTSSPTPTPTKTTESPTPTPSPTKTDNGGAPVVDPGTTSPMDIQTWGVTVQVSGQFGSTQYQITGNTLAITSALTNSFPESCAALRTGWGIIKAAPPAQPGGVVVNNNAYNLAKPAGTCAADTALYNQVWGLMQAMVSSTKALS